MPPYISLSKRLMILYPCITANMSPFNPSSPSFAPAPNYSRPLSSRVTMERRSNSADVSYVLLEEDTHTDCKRTSWHIIIHHSPPLRSISLTECLPHHISHHLEEPTIIIFFKKSIPEDVNKTPNQPKRRLKHSYVLQFDKVVLNLNRGAQPSAYMRIQYAIEQCQSRESRWICL